MVKSQARIQAARFSLVVAAIAVITATDLRLHVNVTTVALTFLIAVLLASAYWGLRYALVLALGAAAAFELGLGDRGAKPPPSHHDSAVIGRIRK